MHVSAPATIPWQRLEDLDARLGKLLPSKRQTAKIQRRESKRR
jgi:hypothetical protein